MTQSNIINIDSSLQLDKIRIEENNRLSNKQYLFSVDQNKIVTISSANEKQEFVDENSSSSANVIFAQAIQKSYGTVNLPTSSVVTYTNLLKSTSSATVTSLYEHVRGYLYRDNLNWPGYITGSNSSYVISKTTLTNPPCINNIGGLSGIRMIVFNKPVFKDSIKPSTLRININPINTTFNVDKGLTFNNSVVSDSDSGNYGSVTGKAGLSGSLSAGISAKAITGFTIAIKFKPANSGPTNQVLLHRRIADEALTSLNYTLASPGINNAIVSQKYSDLNPLSAVTTIVAGSTAWNQDYPAPLTTSPSSVSISITNAGGGQLFWAVSSQTNWISISSAITSGTIFSISNLLSSTATITAYANSNIGTLPAGTTNGNIIIYNSTTSLQKCPNLPLTISFRINFIPA